MWICLGVGGLECVCVCEGSRSFCSRISGCAARYLFRFLPLPADTLTRLACLSEPLQTWPHLFWHSRCFARDEAAFCAAVEQQGSVGKRVALLLLERQAGCLNFSRISISENTESWIEGVSPAHFRCCCPFTVSCFEQPGQPFYLWPARVKWDGTHLGTFRARR